MNIRRIFLRLSGSMQKTLNKDTARLILKSPGRFLSITAIVTIGVAFFVGVSASSPVMSASVDTYDDETGLKDITVYSDYGFDQEDVDAIADTEGVKEASGAYFVDVNAANGTSSYVTRVHSYNADSDINQFVLQEGRLPENDHEAVAEYGSELNSYFEIGDTAFCGLLHSIAVQLYLLTSKLTCTHLQNFSK